METINITAFYDYCLIDIRGVSLAVAQQEIRNALIDFHVKSKLLIDDITAINVVADTHTYTLTPTDAATRAIDIMTAKLSTDTKNLTPATEIALDLIYNDWRTTGSGAPKYYLSVIDRASIRLVKTPDTSITSGLAVGLAVAPTRSATTVQDWVLERWVDAICDRAKARLYAMKKKPWSDAVMFQYHNGLFETAVGSGDIERSQGFARARMRSTAYYR